MGEEGRVGKSVHMRVVNR